MYLRRYALYGALFGLTFPITATIVEAFLTYGDKPFLSAIALAQGSVLLWMIDFTPIFVAFLCGILGWSQDRMQALEVVRRQGLEGTASELFAAAQSLLATVSSLGSTSAETAASVRETTAAMAHLGETANQAAVSAEAVIGLSQASRRASEEGLAAVEVSSGELVKLSEEVRGLSSRIEVLNARMRDIFEVASVVSYIADRSQRLADAAAEQVKAAGAGAGLGEVVSDMRRHAEDARRAALKVKGLVDAAQKAMVAAAAAAEVGVRRAEEGARVASGTGSTIRKLTDALRESSDAAREIADVARQQDHGIEQVLAAMKEIDLAAQETMEASHGLASQARGLSDLANGLQRSVDRAAA